jgi:hypothetical protein
MNTLASISKGIEETADEIAELDKDATFKRVQLKREYARKFLETEASNEVRRYTAELHTHELLLDLERSEQVLRAAKESLRVLRDRLEIGRSLSAIMRMEFTGRD